MKTPMLVLTAACLAVPTLATAQSVSDDHSAATDRVPRSDPTGGAYTLPTLLFVPAAALPTLNVRVTLGADAQAPSGAYDGVRPIFMGEVGLGRGFTVAVGTRWEGGDNPPTSATDRLIAPFGQIRYQLFGSSTGRGWFGGASLTYKQVGFRALSPELEAAFSLHYRTSAIDLGAEAVFGQGLSDAGDHDAELHAFATYRVIPNLALGLSGQVRIDLGGDDDEPASSTAPGKNDVDFFGGGIASFTYDRWQFGTLIGATTLGLTNQAGVAGQLFATSRF